MRAPEHQIPAPPFPRGLTWVNVAPLRMDKQRGRPVLVEFWDFCRVNSLRTLPYVADWHRRYAGAGLRVIGVHTPGFPPSSSEAAVRESVTRLEIEHPVVIDSGYAVWDLYENEGWPARYLFDQQGILVHYHYGEGAYEETEEAISELLEVDPQPLAARRPEDAPGVLLEAQTPDQEGAYSGPYVAGEVWAVLEGNGEIHANGQAIAVDHPGAYRLVRHEHQTAGTLDLEMAPGVTCYAVCFVPGMPSKSSRDR